MLRYFSSISADRIPQHVLEVNRDWLLCFIAPSRYYGTTRYFDGLNGIHNHGIDKSRQSKGHLEMKAQHREG